MEGHFSRTSWPWTGAAAHEHPDPQPSLREPPGLRARTWTSAPTAARERHAGRDERNHVHRSAARPAAGLHAMLRLLQRGRRWQPGRKQRDPTAAAAVQAARQGRQGCLHPPHLPQILPTPGNLPDGAGGSRWAKQGLGWWKIRVGREASTEERQLNTKRKRKIHIHIHKENLIKWENQGTLELLTFRTFRDEL